MISKLDNPNPKLFSGKLLERAQDKLQRLDAGEIKPIPLKYGKEGMLWKIEIGFYRLISADREIWKLFSHEAYNKLFQFKH